MRRRLQALIRAPKILIVGWLRHQEVQFRNFESYLSFPIALIFDDISAISIGAETTIGAFSEIVVRAHSAYSEISGQLNIGKRVVIGSHANIRAAGGEIHIGDNTLIAQHVSLIASGHEIALSQPYRDLPWDTSKVGVSVGQNVWIGANVTVLPGCNIGNNSVIGAGSVVTKSIPPYEVWAGVPAQKLRTIHADDSQQTSRNSLNECGSKNSELFKLSEMF